MNIQEADVHELKSHIQSLILRCKAIAIPFGYVEAENFREEPLATYVPDVAEMVELSRLAQVVLARLIEIDGSNAAQYFATGSLPAYFSQLDNVEDIETETLRMWFMNLQHMISGHTHSLAESFAEEAHIGLVQEARSDHSEVYARYRTKFAELHEMCLQAQIALAYVLRADNQSKYRAGR